MVVDEKITVFKRKKDQITADLVKNKFQNIDDLIQLPIYNFTEDSIVKLRESISNVSERIQILERTKPKNMYMDELIELEKLLV
jgi:hypothetical protein